MGHRSKNSGFSIIQIVVGLAIASFSGMLIMEQLYKTALITKEMNSRTDLEETHYLTNQKSKNIEFISQSLGITNADGEHLNPALDRCLMRKSVNDNCRGFKKDSFLAFSNRRDHQRTGVTGQGVSKSPELRSEILIAMDCDNAPVRSCSEVLVTVNTYKNSDAAQTVPDRVSTYRLPGVVFGETNEIDFQCTALNRVISSIDLVDRRARCDGFTGANQCPNGSPMASYGTYLSCPATENINCPDGVASTGIFPGAGSCLTNAVIPPTTTVTTTMTTVTTSTSTSTTFTTTSSTTVTIPPTSTSTTGSSTTSTATPSTTTSSSSTTSTSSTTVMTTTTTTTTTTTSPSTVTTTSTSTTMTPTTSTTMPVGTCYCPFGSIPLGCGSPDWFAFPAANMATCVTMEPPACKNVGQCYWEP